MFYRMFYILICISIFSLNACTTTEEDSPIFDSPSACPSADPSKEYVGCWRAQGCNVYTYQLSPDGPQITQWSKSQYYLTSDGKLFDFTWRYEQGACSGPVEVYDKGDVVRLKNFTDNGLVTTPSSNNVHSLLVDSPNGGSFSVLLEILADGTMCASNNLNLTKQSISYSSAADVDYNNCADPVGNSN
jgi:hypothetical protein